MPVPAIIIKLEPRNTGLGERLEFLGRPDDRSSCSGNYSIHAGESVYDAMERGVVPRAELERLRLVNPATAREDETLALTWYDFGEPFIISVPPGSVLERPLGWSSVFVPARRAQLTLNGRVATGQPFPEQRGDRMSSTAGLALSETWVRPQ